MSHQEPSSLSSSSFSMPLERRVLLGLLVKQYTNSCLTSSVSGSQSTLCSCSLSLLLYLENCAYSASVRGFFIFFPLLCFFFPYNCRSCNGSEDYRYCPWGPCLENIYSFKLKKTGGTGREETIT